MSVLATLLSQAGLALAFGFWRWSIVVSMLFALAVSIVPTFILSDLLIWSDSKGGRRLHQRAIAFASASVIGSLSSIAFVWLAVKTATTFHANHLSMVVTANVASLGSGFLIWIIRYTYLDRRVYNSTNKNVFDFAPSRIVESDVDEI